MSFVIGSSRQHVDPVFRRVFKTAKSDYLIRHVCLSVFSSTWSNSAPTVRNSIKFGIPVFFKKWRKLHNEKLNDLHSVPPIVRVVISNIMRWAGHVARMEEERGVHRVWVGKPEGKRPLGTPSRRW
jgi:hypothetical protein